MSKIIFFGMPGTFSVHTLTALAQVFPISLVVQGLAPDRPNMSTNKNLHKFTSARSHGFHGLMRWLRSAAATSRGSYDLSTTALALGIDTLVTTNVHHPRVHRLIGQASGDVFVVAGFPCLLRPALLRQPRFGGLNLHPGKLPEQRGPSPLFWTLKSGAQSLTYTIHLLDAGEDTGDIVFSDTIPIELGAAGEDILAACALAAAPALIRAVEQLCQGQIDHRPQSTSAQGRCPRPKLSDQQVDPGRTAREVFTFVCGCAHSHSLFALCGGDRFFILSALSFDLRARLPFEFVLTGDRLLLACTPGVVELAIRENGVVFASEY